MRRSGRACGRRKTVRRIPRVVPPDAGREYGEPGKDLRVGEAEVERDETAQGRTAERGVRGVRESAELAIDAGFQLLDEKAAVEVAVTAAEAWVAGGSVLSHATKAGVINPDEDDRLDKTLAGEAVGGGVGLPGAVWYVGGPAVEEILAVVEIEDGEKCRAGSLV